MSKTLIAVVVSVVIAVVVLVVATNRVSNQSTPPDEPNFTSKNILKPVNEISVDPLSIPVDFCKRGLNKNIKIGNIGDILAAQNEDVKSLILKNYDWETIPKDAFKKFTKLESLRWCI